jgi:hypothetical protein
MLPFYTALAIAILGAYFGGITGFFIWGGLGLISLRLLGLLLYKINGGLIPRSVRDQTATDFIVMHSEVVNSAYPGLTPFEAKQKIEKLLNEIAIMSKILASSIDQRIKPFYFLVGAMRLADDQTNTPERTALIRTLIGFLKIHPLWLLPDY